MTNLVAQIRALKNNDPEAGEEARGWNSAIEAVLELLPVEPTADVSMWMVRGKHEGQWVYFYPGNTRMDVYDGIMERARREGFRGTVQERLEQLGWEVVPMKARLDLAQPENRGGE